MTWARKRNKATAGAGHGRRLLQSPSLGGGGASTEWREGGCCLGKRLLEEITEGWSLGCGLAPLPPSAHCSLTSAPSILPKPAPRERASPCPSRPASPQHQGDQGQRQPADIDWTPAGHQELILKDRQGPCPQGATAHRETDRQWTSTHTSTDGARRAARASSPARGGETWERSCPIFQPLGHSSHISKRG